MKSSTLGYLCLALGLAALLTPLRAAEPAAWKAGAAAVDITPKKFLWMTGFADRAHPATGKAQVLWAKALAFQDGSGRQGVIITLDVCGIPRALSDRVAEELEDRHHLPRRSLLVNVSHTHSGPAVEGFLVAMLKLSDRDWMDLVAYRQELELKMIQVAEQALSQLTPATLSWGVDSTDFAVNRRTNVEKDVPRLRADGQLRGPVDFDVPVLAVHALDGKLIAAAVSYSCHNTTLTGKNYDWSGDYAGYAQAEIERRHPGAVALFIQGCAGNINGLPRGQAAAVDYGRRLADAVDRQLAGNLHPVAGEFRSALEDISLSFAHRPTLEELNQAATKGTSAERNWAHYLLGVLKQRGEIPMSYRYPVQAWRLGDLSIAILGGEAVVDYELRLQREFHRPLWVFGYSNDVMSYIPSESILAEDTTGVHVAGTHVGYEGKDSMLFYGRPSPWAPGLENQIIATAHRVLDAVQKP